MTAVDTQKMKWSQKIVTCTVNGPIMFHAPYLPVVQAAIGMNDLQESYVAYISSKQQTTQLHSQSLRELGLERAPILGFLSFPVSSLCQILLFVSQYLFLPLCFLFC